MQCEQQLGYCVDNWKVVYVGEAREYWAGPNGFRGEGVLSQQV